MHLPHLLPFRSSAVVFLTTCIHQRHSVLACAQVHEVLHDVWSKSAKLNGWYVGQYLLMPDHVHLFACQAPDARPLASWMRLWKSISATRINRSLLRHGPLWQADYFDRFIRSHRDHQEKWDYVTLNPVRKGFVAKTEDWPYRGIIHDLRHHASRG
ncbi:MAG TPA: transposase [Lacunisphaera sp.]